jgi:hypothetical protein
MRTRRRWAVVLELWHASWGTFSQDAVGFSRFFQTISGWDSLRLEWNIVGI